MNAGLIYDPNWTQALLRYFIDIWTHWLKGPLDIGLVLLLTYMVLVIIGERRTLWMVRGFILLMLATAVSTSLELRLLSFVLEKMTIGSAVAMAVILQSEFRRFLEQLGRGEIVQLFQSSRRANLKVDNVIDEIVDAVKELSQNRTGALLILETGPPIDERDFSVPGVKLNSEVSKELLQTIFQTTTLLHDGAVLIRGARIVAAGVILPLSERTASRKLGTRHRAAMGITERVENCMCVVVSEETGSISLAEKGQLNRPLTSSKLKELLEARFSQSVEREAVTPDLSLFLGRLSSRILALVSRFLRLSSSASGEKK
ncbi:MAG: diadenylate cyclase CdaA [Oscillatoriaceae bacterium SKW80]|nr:diadenylate cyclase CdaA [Oscillatoriaceae bacterium SKYG93]MCX8119960.1 diadenylate cyclase CdaA [Oscillatoriaceae bacterium SKW80]MDW8454121.1 diadenylate cyclase CdaA [Oscillatoriaceae cyanobacterium SKYGB_i_bin93]HIK29564.1 TIGR00159 family protein [Oscillatoriaceae cyanobacterium M7585_C2015_266]